MWRETEAFYVPRDEWLTQKQLMAADARGSNGFWDDMAADLQTVTRVLAAYEAAMTRHLGFFHAAALVTESVPFERLVVMMDWLTKRVVPKLAGGVYGPTCALLVHLRPFDEIHALPPAPHTNADFQDAARVAAFVSAFEAVTNMPAKDRMDNVPEMLMAMGRKLTDLRGETTQSIGTLLTRRGLLQPAERSILMSPKLTALGRTVALLSVLTGVVIRQDESRDAMAHMTSENLKLTEERDEARAKAAQAVSDTKRAAKKARKEARVRTAERARATDAQIKSLEATVAAQAAEIANVRAALDVATQRPATMEPDAFRDIHAVLQAAGSDMRISPDHHIQILEDAHTVFVALVLAGAHMTHPTDDT